MLTSGSVEYHWQELWRALILLLDFLANKLEGLISTGGLEQLLQEVWHPFVVYSSHELRSPQTLLLVDFSLCRNEQLLPSPKAVHELVVRSDSVSMPWAGLTSSSMR